MLREVRLDRGWSLDRLAVRSRVSRSTISNIERGLPRGYNVLFLWRLARGLAVPIGSVIDTAVRDLARERQAERLSRPGRVKGGARAAALGRCRRHP